MTEAASKGYMARALAVADWCGGYFGYRYEDELRNTDATAKPDRLLGIGYGIEEGFNLTGEARGCRAI